MVTVIALFPLPDDCSANDAAEFFRRSAPSYLAVEGLLHKSYLFDAAARRGGGAYLFSNRATADAAFGERWRARIQATYGSSPELTYFDTPVAVDPRAGTILGGEATPTGNQ